MMRRRLWLMFHKHELHLLLGFIIINYIKLVIVTNEYQPQLSPS